MRVDELCFHAKPEMKTEDEREILMKKEATDYLANHKILGLLNNLTSMLVFHQPDNPKEYLLEQLIILKQAQDGKEIDCPHLFNKINIESMFEILDPTCQGYVTIGQYEEATKSLRVNRYDDSQMLPSEVTKEVFVTKLMHALLKASKTFYDGPPKLKTTLSASTFKNTAAPSSSIASQAGSSLSSFVAGTGSTRSSRDPPFTYGTGSRNSLAMGSFTDNSRKLQTTGSAASFANTASSTSTAASTGSRKLAEHASNVASHSGESLKEPSIAGSSWHSSPKN